MNKIALSVEKLTKIYTKKEKDHDIKALNKWFKDNPIFNKMAVGMCNSGRRYNPETGMIEEFSYKNAMPGTAAGTLLKKH